LKIKAPRVLGLANLLVAFGVAAEVSPPFKDTCRAEILEEQRKTSESKLTAEKRMLAFEPLLNDLMVLYQLKEFPKELPKPYILQCLKSKNKILTSHVYRGGAPFRAKAQYNLMMGNLEESRKNIKAALTYYDKAQKLLPQDIEVAFKAADMWILTQVAEQNNKNLKLDKTDPDWIRLEKEFLLRFEEIKKNPSASEVHKSRAETAIGRFYQGAEDLKKSKEHYKLAIELDPKNDRPKEFLKAIGP
jgi:tetratricopeptide (TPR) repeat protein